MIVSFRRWRGWLQSIASCVMMCAALAAGQAAGQSVSTASAPQAEPKTVVTLLDDDDGAPPDNGEAGGRIAIERAIPPADAVDGLRAAPIYPSPSIGLERHGEPASARSPNRTSTAPVRASEPVRAQDVRISPGETSFALRAVIGLTVLAVLPAMLVCLTAFLRIIIVLSMLRHAIGMPETPPNTALIGLALFLTLFTMSPVLQTVNTESMQPFMQGRITMEQAYVRASGPMREFMVRQTREQDLALMVELSKTKKPETMDDISNVQLIPAFMLSELRAAFQIGFVVFLPFLLIDLIVSSILMALGMMMMPPMTIALPLKILMFILVDGWSVLLKALVGSFH
ncbi:MULTISPECIES: flagellar type III secretion system pore protein FliP [unclassified Cupriavidus]|uniref:flagellar type III secretion system pore protein FliP n=1 Tax=Cupriavidus sp. H19C3 TaxID=3241603 RepID=UPI003BF86F36